MNDVVKMDIPIMLVILLVKLEQALVLVLILMEYSSA